jgi:hypothetical protein
MFSSIDHADNFDSYSEDEETARQTSAPAKQRAPFEFFADAAAGSQDCGKICTGKNKCFTGILLAAPISALLWVLIFYGLKAIFL